MRSLSAIGNHPASLPLLSDDILEFHAARLILLLDSCGSGGRIDGLTKLAKLDFFVRYPGFFESLQGSDDTNSPVESRMVRHHYGPWDKRYYHVLSFLEARGLVTVTKSKKTFQFALTDHGKEKARVLGSSSEFSDLVDHMKKVKKELGKMSGSSLKRMIYEAFEDEVSLKDMGEFI